jgi:hypothetical protein
VLNDQVLLINDLTDRTKVLGKLHMQVSKILPSEKGQAENEIRLHSGLVELHLRAPTIKEKINWKNALTFAQKNKAPDNTAFEREHNTAKNDVGRKTVVAAKNFGQHQSEINPFQNRHQIDENASESSFN